MSKIPKIGEKNFGLKKLGWKKDLFGKIFWSKKYFGLKKFGSEIVFGNKNLWLEKKIG